jgi:hypothetical protein
MKKVSVVKASEVKSSSLVLDDFMQFEPKHNRMGKITKKSLRNLAEDLGLSYTDTQIAFAKKMIIAYMQREG